jgi:hypothetical protein
MIWPVLGSYQCRFRSSVASPNWTIRLSDRSSGSIFTSFFTPKPDQRAFTIPMMIRASEPPMKQRRFAFIGFRILNFADKTPPLYRSYLVCKRHLQLSRRDRFCPRRVQRCTADAGTGANSGCMGASWLAPGRVIKSLGRGDGHHPAHRKSR